ncbi:MAG: alpha/beta fold hydrolase BchO [Pseudomonadota bacterium]
MSALDWDSDGRTWPNREQSAFVRDGPIVWHVQRAGSGPQVLLLHGTAASTHSWSELFPELARRFHVTAVDLPDHGFTRTHGSLKPSLTGVASALSALLAKIDMSPDFLVGHSAGAAIAMQMVLEAHVEPERIISLNGAVVPFEGHASVLFPALAKAIQLNPLAAPAFAWAAKDRKRVARLIAQTGSNVSAEYIDGYARLLRSSNHVAGALAMMANWNLAPLFRNLDRVDRPVHLLVGANDLAVPPKQAEDAANRLSDASLTMLDGVGHLAHEEDARRVATLIVDALSS